MPCVRHSVQRKVVKEEKRVWKKSFCVLLFDKNKMGFISIYLYVPTGSLWDEE